MNWITTWIISDSWAQILTEIVKVTPAILAAIVGLFSYLQSRKNTAKIDVGVERVNKLEGTVNGKMETLLENTANLARSEGRAELHEELKSEIARAERAEGVVEGMDKAKEN